MGLETGRMSGYSLKVRHVPAAGIAGDPTREGECEPVGWRVARVRGWRNWQTLRVNREEVPPRPRELGTHAGSNPAPSTKMIRQAVTDGKGDSGTTSHTKPPGNVIRVESGWGIGRSDQGASIGVMTHLSPVG